MINYDTLQDDLYDIISPLTELSLIRDFQSDLRPNERYVTYRITTVTPIGFEQFYSTDVDGEQKIVQTYSLTLRISVIGPDAARYAVPLHMRMQRPSVIDSLDIAGLHLYDRSEIKDVPRFIANGYEDRSLFDFSFYLRVEDYDSPGWIEFVQLIETITKPDNTVAVQETVTIDLTP